MPQGWCQELNKYYFWRRTKDLERAQKLGLTAASSMYCLTNRLMMSLLSLCTLSYFISIKCRQAGQIQNIYDRKVHYLILNITAVLITPVFIINRPELR